MALTTEQTELVAERRQRMLTTIHDRFNSDAFRMFIAMGELIGSRLCEHQVGLWKLAIYGDREGSITETYDEVGDGEIRTVTVTTDNEKMLLKRDEGGWWEFIEREFVIDPMLLVGRADPAEFRLTRFDERMFRTVRTSDPWTFEEINGMPGYGVLGLDDLAIGKALGIVGGQLPGELHPIAVEAFDLVAPMGVTSTAKIKAIAGYPPYIFKLDGTPPAWIKMLPDGTVTATPPLATAIDNLELTYTVTGVDGVSTPGIVTIDVVAAP